MPFASVTLVPGVNLERTPTLLEAGYESAQLIRFKDGLAQKLGGWTRFIPTSLPGVPRELHAWSDLNSINHLGYGSTTQLGIITNTAYANVTPQIFTTNPQPAFQGTTLSTTIIITDPGITTLTTYDAVQFLTPVNVAGVTLSGVFPVVSVNSPTSFNINAATTASVINTLNTNHSSALGSTVLQFTSVPAWVQQNAGLIVVDLNNFTAVPNDTVVVSSNATSITISNALASAVATGDAIILTSIPRFTTVSASPNITVELVFSNLNTVTPAPTVVFPTSTTNTTANVTINGAYQTISSANSSSFVIAVSNLAASSLTFDMNGGLARLLYYINLGPFTAASGYGVGGYGSSGYGITGASSVQTGSEISALDWDLDNWGKLLVAIPKNQGVYVWDPNGGFANAHLVPTAPIYNTGGFVSTSQQILVVYGSTINESIGLVQDPMLVAWSASGDYTTFAASSTNQAGTFRIPIGSKIVAGLATPHQNFIWTDIDLWAMNYIGLPFVFGFNKIGSGAGAVSQHSIQALRGHVYWMGPNNFFEATENGIRVMQCTVWDFVFQNLNTAFQANVRSMPNTPFNEAGWLFPSNNSTTGECDSYVKVNITEQGQPWDAGFLSRSAAIDYSLLGGPFTATPGGIVYQQETSMDADSQPLMASFTTGYFMIGDGEDFAFVDRIYPDMKWGFFGQSQGAAVLMSFNVTDYPGDTPVTYGPYNVMQTTEYIDVNFRGRQMSITLQSTDVGSFWRIGRIRYRWAAAGRR